MPAPANRSRPARPSVRALRPLRLRLLRSLALVALAAPATLAAAQVFPPDAWLVRERIDAETGADTSLAILGAAVDPRQNDGAIALRCSPDAPEGFQAFIDFDTFHGNEGVFEVGAAWEDADAEALPLATSADLSAGFVLAADKLAFVRDLRTRGRLAVLLIDAQDVPSTYLWELPDGAALDDLACLP